MTPDRPLVQDHTPRAKKRALLIIDAQNTFCEGGKLQVKGGIATVKKIAQYLQEHGNEYDAIIISQDWHVDVPDHFKQWGEHGVAGSEDADFRPELKEALKDFNNVIIIRKGEYEDAYSAFMGHDLEGKPLHDVLQEHEIDELDTTGIAQNFCVKDTSIDGAKLGYPVTLLTDLTVGIPDLPPEFSIESASEAMREAGVQMRSLEHGLSI